MIDEVEEKINNVSTKCPVCNSSNRSLRTQIPSEVEPYRTFSLFQCEECSHNYLFPLPKVDELTRFYNKEYSPYQEVTLNQVSGSCRTKFLIKLYGTYWFGQKIFKTLFGWIFPEYPSYRKNGRFVDIGCGSGRNLMVMKILGWNVTGVDMELSFADYLRKNDIRVITGDIMDSVSKLPSGSFDVVLSCHSLEHFAKPKEVIKQANRITVTGGEIIIVVPDLDSWFANICKSRFSHFSCPGHLHFFSKQSLATLLNMCGYKIVQWGSTQTPSSLVALRGCNKSTGIVINIIYNLVTRVINLFKLGDVMVVRAVKCKDVY